MFDSFAVGQCNAIGHASQSVINQRVGEIGLRFEIIAPRVDFAIMSLQCIMTLRGRGSHFGCRIWHHLTVLERGMRCCQHILYRDQAHAEMVTGPALRPVARTATQLA